MKLKVLTIMAMAIVVANVAQGKPIEPTQKQLAPAVKKYLQQKGHLCLGKFVWPIEVSEHDRQIETNDAIQMPILEKLGLVTATEISAAHDGTNANETDANSQPIKRYELTAAGKQYYLQKETTSIGPGDKVLVHHGDFCVAQLSLNKVVSWEPPTVISGHEQTLVKYTYKISAADWTRDPQVQQVFPMVDRIIKGENTLQLTQLFRLTNGTWLAVNAVQ